MNDYDTEDKFYMGWAIKIAQTSTFRQAADHLREFLKEAMGSASPAQNLTPAQEKLCETESRMAYAWGDRETREIVLKFHARNILAAREPAPQVGHCRDCCCANTRAESRSFQIRILELQPWD